MSEADPKTRMVLVDASVFITLAEIDLVDALLGLDGAIVVPTPVVNEIASEPAARNLGAAVEAGSVRTMDVESRLDDAANHLGRAGPTDDPSGDDRPRVEGDIALLALALHPATGEFETARTVVVTDDKPLRKTCKTLSIPVSGSIGVLVRAVERGSLEPAIAKEKLYAMDEVGARLSASHVRKEEREIDEAAEK